MRFSQEEMESIQTLSEEFAKIVKRWIGEINIIEMNGLNHTEKDKGVCHSHDFCDANMAMDEAFEEVFGREPELEDDSIDNNMWQEAWDIAKIANFYFDERAPK